jgi:hypothetical protein
MPAPYSTNQQISIFSCASSPNLQQIRVGPERLSRSEVDAVLVQIDSAFSGSNSNSNSLMSEKYTFSSH